jgi:hypothetical protein
MTFRVGGRGHRTLDALADLNAGIPAYSEEPTPRVTYCRRVA